MLRHAWRRQFEADRSTPAAPPPMHRGGWPGSWMRTPASLLSRPPAMSSTRNSDGRIKKAYLTFDCRYNIREEYRPNPVAGCPSR